MDLGTIGVALNLLFVLGLTWWLWTSRNRRATRPAGSPSRLPTPAGPLPVQRILFEGNTATLSATAIADLDRLALWLKSCTVKLRVEGSADDTGHQTKNRQLARARAAIAQRALLAHGIAAGRLVVVVQEPGRGNTERERELLRCVMFREVSEP